jgi:LPS export ABC transporter protein LptC
LALFLLFFASGCQKEEPPQVSDDSFGQAVEQVIENMEITFTEGGRRTGVLTADSVAILDSGKMKKGKRITVDFFDQEGHHVSTLTASEGIYNSPAEEVQAKGNVVVISDDGARLETELLSWRKEANRVFTDAFVTITRGKSRVTGYGLSTDPQLADVHILKDVQGRIEDVQKIIE